MAWARLDDKMHSDPKILRAGNAAVGLFVRSISYCCDQLTDGFVPAEWARANGKPAEIQALLDTNLWHKVDDGYDVVRFLTYNRRKSVIEEERRRKSEGGKRGAALTNQSRWGSAPTSAYPDIPPEVSGDGSSVAPSPSPTPLTQSRGFNRSFKGSNASNDLPFEKTFSVEKLLGAIGDDADEGTEGVVCSYARQLSEGALAYVNESVQRAVRSDDIKDRARYVVGALKSEIEQRQAA